MAFQPAVSKKPDRTACWVYALIAAAILLAYWPSLRNGFVWDDDAFLTDNPLIKAPDGLARFWLTTAAPDYWPVTSSSLWLEWRLWGLHAAGYHATNLLLHAACVMLLWKILRKLSVRGALLGALLFAVHPVNVESVAWIAQRKNVLAMLFYLASIGWFLDNESADAGPGQRPALKRAYWLSLGAFILALLSKGSVAPMPLVLAGLIWWRNRRLCLRDFARLAPFFAVAAGLAAVNVWFEVNRAGAPAGTAGPLAHVLGAGAAGWFYLWKAAVPLNLAFIYPSWHIDPSDWRWWIPITTAVAATVALYSLSRRGFRAGLGAWLYFWVMLLPVLGFAQVYFMKYSLVADHYQYLALIGLTSLAGAGLNGLHQRYGRLAMAASAAIVSFLAVLTWRQCGIYQDSEILYRATLRRNPACWVAHTNLGNLLVQSGRLPEALDHFDTALRIRPDDAETENDLGAALARMGRLQEAMPHYASALRIDPHCAQADYNWGLALRDAHRDQEALIPFEDAVRLAPGFAEGQNALGLCLYDLGRVPDAVTCYRNALVSSPDDPEALANLGVALLKLNQVPEALLQFEHAEQVKPSLPALHYNLGIALARSNRLDGSIAEFRQELRLNPGNTDARLKLAAVLRISGRSDVATPEEKGSQKSIPKENNR